MGTQLLRRVEAAGMGGRLDRLGHSARLVLYVMALNARDTPTDDGPAATYWRGWEHLARAALGRATYDASAERAVAKAVAELVDAGYLKRAGRRHGQRQSPVQYEVTL